MNKNLILGITITVIVLGGGWMIASNQAKNDSAGHAAMEKEMVDSKDAMMKKDDAAMEKIDDKMMTDQNSSNYVEYTKETLEQAANKRRILYFYASWCPTCRPADADLKANESKIPKDVTVLRTNYNDPDTDQEEKELAKKYAVTYQHTFVQIDANGNEVTKWNGGQTKELLANIK